MKALNAKAALTLNKLVQMMDDGYIKLDNTEGSFMPVSVETIFENEKYTIFSLAHYFEQCGDLMADPEMLFIYSKAMNVFFPSYFKQDNIGIEQESIVVEGGEIKGYRVKMQSDQTSFANTWLKNIKYQQKL
jgi:hypothetical protein